MRRLFALVVSVLALVVASCSYDDTAVWNKVNSLEDRVAKLEELCKKANSDIEALQTIVEALQQNDYVVSVAPVVEGGKTVGYTITFAKSGEVTIYNGKDGKDGVDGDGSYVPNIGVKKDVDGIYYWTLDGEWLLDESGNKVPAQGEQGADGAQGEQGQPGEDGQDGQDGQDGKDGKDGVTPKLKIENDYWYVSYDNGATWSVVGKATAEGTSAGDSIFERVEVENDCVIFYLTDGSSFTLPISNQTDGDIIRFLDNAVKIRCVMNWDTDGDNELSKAEAAKVTSLDDVFRECDAIVAFDELKYFTGLTEIEPYAFCRALNLHKITLPESIKSIGGCAFAYCYRLKQLNINEGVTKIGYGAFAGCRSLKSITIPGRVEEIQLTYEEYNDYGELYIEYANPFVDCRSLEAIYSPYASDGRSLIMDNTLICVASKGINEYTIPAEVKSVANNALGSSDYDYDGVRFPKVVIPESVEYIDHYGLLAAEYHFESMTPPSMHENALGYWSDYGNSVRPVIYVPDGALDAYLASDWSERYKSCIYFDIEDVPADNIIKYTTTDGQPVDVNIDGAIMHSYIDGVGYIVFPEPVTTVRSRLFGYYGDNVLTVTLPDSVIEIGDYAFENCSSLENITIPQNVTSIGYSAFRYCSNLSTVYCKPFTPPYLDDGNFYYTQEIYVPNVEIYSSNQYWSKYASILVSDSTLQLVVDKSMAVVGDTIRFTVLDANENDVTADATIFNALTMEEVGAEYVATEVGAFRFIAFIGDETSNSVDVAVLSSILAAPADPDPSNLAFNHRGLFVFHTGVNVSYSPSVMNIFHDLAETDASKHYNEVAVHSYSSNDPAKSSAAQIVSSFYYISGYPTVNLNFYGDSVVGAGRYLSEYTDLLYDYIQEDGADAGIAMAVEGTSSQVLCTAEIKANVAQEYKVTAWLLESNIYANQAGATQDYHNIHNFALRNIAGDYSAADLSGESIGVLSNAETKTISYAIPVLSDSWNVANMGVLVIVSAKDENGRWEVANTAYCPVGETKAYEYVNSVVEDDDVVNSWIGTYTAYTEQLIDFSTDGNDIINQRTDFTITVSEYEEYSDWCLVSGLSVLGEEYVTLGQIVEGDGVSSLIISNMVQLSDVGSGYYATWFSFAEVSDGSQSFVRGDFGAMTFVMSADGTIEYMPRVGKFSDGNAYVVTGYDHLAYAPETGDFAYFTDAQVWKYGEIKGITKIDSPYARTMSESKKQLKVGEIIPASMVVAM